jgi:hypothetical protein
VTEVELPNVPKSRDEALRYNDETERQLQFHTRTQPIAPPATGERAAIYHGQGVGIDDTKDNIVEYFRLVDRGLHDLLRNERAPLILAGVEYLLPLYKEVTTYAHVVDNGITGNPDGLRADALHEQAWSVVEPLFRKDRLDAVARYRRLAGTGRATSDLQEVVAAAYHGRVEALFVAVGVQKWGTFHPHTQEITLAQAPAPENDDLLDFAALHTFLNSGTVYAVSPDNVPDNAPLAAVLRY